MRKQSKIRSLPSEDQKRILELCSQHTYDEVAGIVAKPRDQGGLDFKTNRSALSRFACEHGPITITSNLTSQFLDILEQQPTDFDELVPHITNLIAKSAFLLVAQHRPYEEYRRPLETFLRLEKLCRVREQILAEREEERRAWAQRTADLKALNLVQDPVSKNNPPAAAKASNAKPPQPPKTPVSSTPQPAPVTLDFALPSFQTPATKTPASSKPQNTAHAGNPVPPEALYFPKQAGPVSHFSLENTHNLTNPAKSHLTTSPSETLPFPGNVVAKK